MKFLLSKKHPPHPNPSAVFDPELRPKGAHVEALPLSFDPEALDGEGGGEGGGDFLWLRRSRAVISVTSVAESFLNFEFVSDFDIRISDLSIFQTFLVPTVPG